MRTIAPFSIAFAILACLGPAQDPRPTSQPAAAPHPILGSEPVVVVIESSDPPHRSVVWTVGEDRFGDTTALRMHLLEMARDPAQLRIDPADPDHPVLATCIVASTENVTYRDVVDALEALKDAGFPDDRTSLASGRVGHAFVWQLRTGETLTRRYTELPRDGHAIDRVRVLPAEATRAPAAAPGPAAGEAETTRITAHVEGDKPVVTWGLDGAEPVEQNAFVKALAKVADAARERDAWPPVILTTHPKLPRDTLQFAVDRLFRLGFEEIRFESPEPSRDRR